MMRGRLEDYTDTPRTVEQEIDAVNKFSMDMLEKLRKNAHKKHWNDVSVGYLLERLKEEVAELEQAIAGGYVYTDVISEAADVGNLAMMIADKLRGHD